MAYQVLARKYRPGTLAEVVGQPQTVKALVNAFDRQQLHHAYLFSGTRGVGKTTLARIIAKCLNCKEGVTSEPCGVCENCVAIANGSYVDLIEVDGASRNKVEETRDLLEDIAYRATMGAYKVYIIDEVHALSDSSFQTLLKSLEEPPEHVKFVLATTNPDKVPVTVRSRCIHFHLRNIGVETIEEHLKMVLEQEEIGYDDASVHAIARMGRGSMRDALSLTDQAIALCGSTLSEATVLDMLGSAPQNDVALLLEQLIAGDREQLFVVIGEIAQRGVDFAELLTGLENSVHSLAMAKATRTSPGEELAPLLNRCDPAWLQQAYQVLIMGGRDLQYAPEPRVGFEMTILRLLDFVPLDMKTSDLPPDSEQQRSSTRSQDVSTEPRTQPVATNELPDEPRASQVADAPPEPQRAGSDRADRPAAKRDPFRDNAKRRKEKSQMEHQQRLAQQAQDEARAMAAFENDEYVDSFRELFNAKFRAQWRSDTGTKN